MRKIKKGLLTVFLTLSMCLMLVFGIACVEDNNVTVEFNTNGGVAISAVELEEGASYTLPVPTKEGSSFEGWYTNAEFTGEAVTEIVAESDVTYYAKWEQLYLLTLDANGGTMDGTNSIYLKAGESVYSYVENCVPTKENHQFGAWFNGENALSKNEKMPAAALTLTAKYKVAYTVEIWEQNLTLDGYTKRAEDIVAYEYAGETVISEQKIAGFAEVVTENTVSSKVISETASENVFKHYFDRETYRVTFNVNYPDGSVGENDSVEKIYGAEVELPSHYTFEGYCLMGWSTSATGEVVYKANYIEQALYGSTATENETFLPERNTTLYAVWQKGYVDMFGNSDYVYLIEEEVVDEESGETSTEYSVYLSRGGVLFKGEYRANTKTFSFVNNNDKTMIEGRLNDDGRTYIYKNAARADYANTMFQTGVGLVESTKVYLDEYDGITYSVTTDGVSAESEGTYYVDEYGYFTATFTEGELAGQTLVMMFGYVQDQNGTYQRAFQVRNEDEYNMGTLVRFGIYQNAVSYYMGYQVVLDGFGTAYMFTDEQNYTNYYYSYDPETDVLVFYGTSGAAAGTAKVLEYEIGGETVKGYAMYTEDQAGTFTFAGGTLTLDGIFNVTYEKKDGATVTGFYMVEGSAFGGMLVSFRGSDGADYKFMITEMTYTVGEFTFTTTEIEEKSVNYAEYYYTDPEGIYYAPMLTVNDPEEGKATLYGYTSSRTYEEISSGTLVYDEQTGLYTYTAKDFVTPEVEVLTTPVDLSKIQTMVCALDTTTTSYAIHYWYSYDTEESEPVKCDKFYTSSLDDNAELTLVSGIAIYKANGAIIMGQYVKDEESGLTSITTASGATLYVKLDEENEEFVALSYAPYNAYILMDDGDTISRNEYLSFDGLGGVSYTVITKATNEEEEDTTVTYVGTMEQLDETTLHGVYIYLFKAEATGTTAAQEFKFVLIPYGNSALFAKENTAYKTTYQSEKYGKLELDGFGYFATYKDADGNAYESKYYITEENQVSLVMDEVARYFDLSEDGTFVLRGDEYGSYYYVKNQYMENLYLEMDGKGNLVVYKMAEVNGEYERQDIDVEGSYERSGDAYTLKYVDNGESKTLQGEVGYYGDYPVFIEKMTNGIAQTYVNAKDLTVLTLDELGNATKYTENGVMEYGYYTVITDTMLYYVNEAATDACIYNYDKATGSATLVKFEPRGYYTADLESLLFTEYGFAIFGGETRYYYNIDDSNNVTIYIEAETGEDHNGYGFKAINFGEFANRVTWNNGDGEKEYFATDGYSILFKRSDDQTKYPVNGDEISGLSFAPTGDGEFTVTGSIIIGGSARTCYVTRVVDEEGNAELYVTCGNYRFDISVVYNGDNLDGTSNNTFEIKKMRWIFSAPSYSFTMMYYIYYMFGGAELANSLENTIGQIDFVIEYDEAGEEVKNYLTATFLEDSRMYNTKGEIVTLGELPVYNMDGEQVEVGSINVSGEVVYKVSFVSEGYTYHLYFAIGPSYMENVYAYQVVALTREEVLTSEDGYTVTLESVIASDTGYSAGYPYSVKLTKTEGETVTEIKGEAWYIEDGYLYYIVREKNEVTNLIESSTFYKILLKEAVVDDGTLGGEEEDTENKNPVPVYQTTCTVAAEPVTTIYAENKVDFIDVNDVTGKVMILAMQTEDGQTAWIVYDNTYNEETDTYIVYLTETISYTVKVEEGESGESYVTITENVVEEDDEETVA